MHVPYRTLKCHTWTPDRLNDEIRNDVYLIYNLEILNNSWFQLVFTVIHLDPDRKDKLHEKDVVRVLCFTILHISRQAHKKENMTIKWKDYRKKPSDKSSNLLDKVFHPIAESKPPRHSHIPSCLGMLD